MRDTEDAAALDATGRLRAAAHLADTTADSLATSVCIAVRQLLGRQTSVVSCSVLGQGSRPFAMVMLRDHIAGGFLSGTASGKDSADALVQAVLAALGLGDGILAAIAERWRAMPGVDAVALVEGEEMTSCSGCDDQDALARLARTLPAPGRLAVTTADAEYRVLRLPAAALAVVTTSSAAVLEQIDGWMAAAEALGP
jgi:hypothetical protein